MYRLMLDTVRPEFVAIWRFAAPPTRRSPSLVKATATQELVVPRSIPITLLIVLVLFSSAQNISLNILPVSYDDFLEQM